MTPVRYSAVGLAAGVLLLGLTGIAAEAEGGLRPNILFIAVDDLRPEFGCYGQRHIHSPNLDRLAARGMVFERAYCQQAVCSPSRTSLMTGLRPDATRVYNLETHFRDTVPDAVTLPQHFRRHGYHAVGMGKIYHNGLNDAPSWNEWHKEHVGGELYVRPENKQLIAERRAAARKKGLKGNALSRAAKGPPTEMADVPDEAYSDGALAAFAVKTLGRLSQQNQPFFLAVGFMRPHLPFNAPKRYWDLYDPTQIRLADNPFPPKNAPALAGTSWGELRAYAGMPEQGPLTDDQARCLRHGYYACVSFLDANVGRLLDELDRLNLADRTVMVLWGDHGWKLGEHSWWCKHTNFELDARAPLLVADPRASAKGGRSRALVEFVDIYPTLCDLAGLPQPPALEGSSFASLLTKPHLPWKRAAFSQYPRGSVMGYSMKTDTHRLTVWKDRKKQNQVVATELYDHVKDPGENENVAGQREYAAVLQQLLEWHQAGWVSVRQGLRGR